MKNHKKRTSNCQQRHEEVVNTLIRRIYNRQLKPGEKLLTERRLSLEMGVDRTSLRVALKRLESMNLLDIRHGDGIYVKDYMEHAGVDFLGMLFRQQELSGKERIVDEYIIDEVWEFWIEFFPTMFKVASKRYSPRDLKALMDIFDEELLCLADKERIVELEVLSQDLVARETNNILYILFTNSTRPLRRKMTEMFISLIDEETLRNHIEIKKILLREFMRDPEAGVKRAQDRYHEILTSYRHTVRKLWQASVQEEMNEEEVFENYYRLIKNQGRELFAPVPEDA